MFCSQCGNKVDPSSRFCPSCGAAISTSAPPFSGPSYSHTAQMLRPRNDRMIGGVCAAFALHFGWDLNLVRILTAVFTFFSVGLGILAYLAAWIIIPEAPYSLPAKSL